MSRVAFVADVHLDNFRMHGGPMVNGMNTRGAQAVQALRGAVRKAKVEGCIAFVVAGDLFDSSRPTPQMLAATQDVLAEADGMRVIILVGNHDQNSAGPGDNALAPLREWAEIIERPQVVDLGDGRALACIPFRAEPAANWFVETVEAFPRGEAWQTILAMHLGVSDASTAPWLLSAKDAIGEGTVRAVLSATGMRAAFAGNWHNRAVWESEPGEAHGDRPPFVVQCGALVPTGWDNPGLDDYGGLVVYDFATDAAVIHDIPGPRFVKVRNEVELKKVERAAKIGKHHLYARLAVEASELAASLEMVEGAKQRGVIVDVAVESNEAEARAASAAYAATQAESLDEAVAAFVGQMDLPEDVNRDGVTGRVLGFLR